jgi:hypothetical protein
MLDLQDEAVAERNRMRQDVYADRLNFLVRTLSANPPDSSEFKEAVVEVVKLRQEVKDDPALREVRSACDSVLVQVASALGGTSTPEASKTKKKRAWGWLNITVALLLTIGAWFLMSWLWSLHSTGLKVLAGIIFFVWFVVGGAYWRS